MGHLANTRAGWNAERLAEYVLAKIVFVGSPKTVSDDVGIDFNCTLFKTVPGDYVQLVPTLPFIVQVKSAGDRVSLTKHLPMLRQTPLPFMVAIADVDQNRVSLYSGRYVRFAMAWYGAHPKSLVAYLVPTAASARDAVRARGRKVRRVQVDFPRLAVLRPGSEAGTLERVRDQVEREVREVGLNNYNALVDQYVFRFPSPRAETRILAGSGSARRFREVMADRITEYARNVWWPASFKGKSRAQEAAACLAAAEALWPYIPHPPHLTRALEDVATIGQ